MCWAINMFSTDRGLAARLRALSLISYQIFVISIPAHIFSLQFRCTAQYVCSLPTELSQSGSAHSLCFLTSDPSFLPLIQLVNRGGYGIKSRIETSFQHSRSAVRVDVLGSTCVLYRPGCRNQIQRTGFALYYLDFPYDPDSYFCN